MIRIATFNLENLFTRPTAMSGADDEAGRQAIEDHAELNRITAKPLYTDADKLRLLALSDRYGFHSLNAPANADVYLNKIRGQLFRDPQNGPPIVVANGRADWTGWFELRRTNIEWQATFNTGRVIAETNPQIVITVEVENRPTLERFNEQVLGAQFDRKFPYYMVIDGNDQRGIDVGVLSRFPIESVRSHTEDTAANGSKLFSRDCPEFDVRLPSQHRITLLANHLKSKRNGNDQASRDRRRAQAAKAHEYALEALNRSSYVLLAGDLNDTPASEAILPLLSDDFADVMTHPDYPQDRPGTYTTGLANEKIDYLIMSPALRARLRTTGIERRGTYHPRLWQSFDTVKKTADEASDHHLVWADFEM